MAHSNRTSLQIFLKFPIQSESARRRFYFGVFPRFLEEKIRRNFDKMSAADIYYSKKYQDDFYEYRLAKRLALFRKVYKLAEQLTGHEEAMFEFQNIKL